MNSFGKKIIDRFVKKGVSPHKIAWSSSWGMYLAFSPFLGIQTVLVFLVAFFFRAQASVVFTVLYTVNNPWTMIPIVLMDYLFGVWLFQFFGISMAAYEPLWMGWVNAKLTPYLTPYLGVQQLKIWPYLVGGNIIAIVAACITYPVIKRVYLRGLEAAKRRVA